MTCDTVDQHVNETEQKIMIFLILLDFGVQITQLNKVERGTEGTDFSTI
jgi:hypothetical protein